jgi:hypothetical protein
MVGARNECDDMPKPVASMSGPLSPARYLVSRKNASPPSLSSACHRRRLSHHQMPSGSLGSRTRGAWVGAVGNAPGSSSAPP